MDSTINKSHFDSLHGGNVEIPQSVYIKPFIRARMEEIEALTQLIETPSNNILLKHQFPKHMRRRAMSQNVKRIPKRLREHHIDMREKSGIREIPIKRPRRKYRRRPQNLLSEYNRRQRKFIWLETHIWHAKRFRMVEKWGYKLPNFPNNKSYRACYRATSKHCLIQDISFYCCIELVGLLNELLEGLRNHTNIECGLTFDAKHIQTGSTEGNIMFFGSCKYPYGAIGEINYIWQPSKLSTNNIKVLWLWCHPSYFLEVFEELIKTFALEQEHLEELETVELMEEDRTEEPHPGTRVKNVEAIKLETRNIPFVKTPKYSSLKNSVKMIILKDTLNRFRLTGPSSQALITSVFKPIDLSKRAVNDWCCEYINRTEISRTQLQFWNKMKNISDPGQLPPNIVVGLIAVDPRFTMPAHISKAVESFTDMGSQILQSIEEGLSCSPIWSNKVRDEVTENKLSTHRLNELRSNKLVPGFEVEQSNDQINDLPAVPCLFLQRPGTHMDGKPLGYSSGWDIIVPAGYGQPVWLGLVMHGGRAGGLKETDSIFREAGKLHLPPDTSAGKLEDDARKSEMTNKFFRLPPAKRPNYIKLGFQNPFHSPWNILINDWANEECEFFFVLRNREKLLSLRNKLKRISNEFQFELKETTALVGVMLILKGKGNIGSNSLICIPSKTDLKKLKEDPHFKGPVEGPHTDDLESKRKMLLKDHRKQLKSLARIRQKERKREEKIGENSKSDAVVFQHNNMMKKLWLPDCNSVKDSVSRTVIGFITKGDFSFTSAKSSGVGYVSLKGLLALLEEYQKNLYVLVRNSNTDQYRFASMSIISS